MTTEDKSDFKAATQCWRCDNALGDDKVRHQRRTVK